MSWKAVVALRPGVNLTSSWKRAPIELAPVTSDHAQAARRAWRRFGKGNHPAGLNFGDCFAYALAEATREPLLFKGGDFPLTDVQRPHDATEESSHRWLSGHRDERMLTRGRSRPRGSRKKRR